MERCRPEGVSIAGIYYAHGLKCAKYPAQFIVFVGVVTIICSLPFFITTSGDVNSPKPWRSPWLNYRIPSTPHDDKGGARRRGNGPASDWIVNDPSKMSVRTPIWFLGLPSVIFQQIYVNVQLDCDTFGELCQNAQQHSLSKKTTALMIESLLTAERSCSLVLHPAVSNFAHIHSDQDASLPPFIASVLSPLLDNFQQKDSDPLSLKAIQANISLHTLKELFYGGFWEVSHAHSTGKMNTRYKEQRFAITFALHPTVKNFDQITECVNTLNNIWPMESSSLQFMKHIYYESEWTVYNFAPLICLYSIVFLYISFSVGKIDLVRSKLGLGFTAVITVICSLTMSLGICTFFGLSITVSGSEIFPFVVVVIGLENILIITKAVISTDPGLEVKYRIAEGLGKEGRALTKNMFTVLGLVILGIFTFNYAMKEFCIIALVGLLCDYFLHITFFTTVLSIDLRRMELTELSFHANKPSSQVAERPTWRIPKRERVNNFLVRNRFAQRFFAVVIVLYFMSVISHTERFQNFVSTVVIPAPQLITEPQDLLDDEGKISTLVPDQSVNFDGDQEELMKNYVQNILAPDLEIKEKHVSFRSDEDGFSVKCGDESYCLRQMVTTHWPRLLSFYNITLEKRFITVLPPIMLNHRLGFSTQKLFAKTSSTKDLLEALSDVFETLLSIPNVARGIFLQIVSDIVVVYVLILCYEASRMKKKEEQQEKETQKLTAVFKLRGHVQDIECLSIDNGSIATASLEGMVHLWDIGKRECSIAIDRRELSLRDYQDSISRHVEGCESSDVKSSTPPVTSSATSSLSSIHSSMSKKPRSSSFSASSLTSLSHPLPTPPLAAALPSPSLTPPTLPSPPQPSLPQRSPSLPSPPLESLVSTSLSSASAVTSTPTTIFPVHLPQKIIPGFLKRLSMPTILKRSPDKPEKPISEEEDSGLAMESSSVTPNFESSPSQTPVSPQGPLQQNFQALSNNSRSSSLASLNSNKGTKAVTTYSRPLVSHTELSSSSKRSLRSVSMDSSNAGTGAPVCSPENTSVSNWSAESVSLVSEDNSDIFYDTPEMFPSPKPQQPLNNSGFQYTRHFSFYSQFTSELALMHCPSAVDELWETFAPAPVWCIDLYNGTIVIGCGNGQIEAWSVGGSLKFRLTLQLPGITVIKAHPIGIVTGHLDGSLQLTGHHGQLMHGVLAHRSPVTSLFYTGDCVVSGGHDSLVKVYRITDFMCVRSLTVHRGSITTLSLIDSEFCLSACAFGIVCLWEYKTACILHKFECRGSDDIDRDEDEYSFGVVKACCNSSYIIALLRDNRIQIWNREDGYLSNIIEMGLYTHDITILSPSHFAIALQAQIVVYDIASRHEVTRKDLNAIGMPIVRHLTSLEPSTVICTTGREVQLVPTGLKIKME